MTTSPRTEPGGLLERFLARLVDGVLLGAVGAFVIGLLVVGGLLGERATGYYGATSVLAGVVSSVLWAALYLGYYALLESRRGQTVGKVLLNLRVVSAGGGNPTVSQSLRRNLWNLLGLLGIVPFVGGALGGLLQIAAVVLIAVGIANDPVSRRGWHDDLAGTRVVRSA